MLNKKKIAGAVLSFGILGCVGLSASPVALAAPVQDAARDEVSIPLDKVAAIGAEGSQINALWNGSENNRAYYVTNDKSEKKYVSPGWHKLYDKKYFVDKNNQWAHSAVAKIDGRYYFFDEHGAVKSNKLVNIKGYVDVDNGEQFVVKKHPNMYLLRKSGAIALLP